MRTFRDRLSRLNFIQAAKLLGPQGQRLIYEGGKLEVNIVEDAVLMDDSFLLRLDEAEVTLRMHPAKDRQLHIQCSHCQVPCLHQGAALALILEEKLFFGLAAAPEDKTPLEFLSESDLEKRALAERQERARKEKMTLESLADTPWSDYLVTNASSGKTYRLALRGFERGASYCSCPDYRRNTLGTCKHILFALEQIKARFPAQVLKTPYQIKEVALYLHYGRAIELRLLMPQDLGGEEKALLAPIADAAITDMKDLLRRIKALEDLGTVVHIYPDAEECIEQQLYRLRVQARVAEIRKDPAHHPLRCELLKVPMLPYQLDGVAFAVGAGRAILADDMGLGKTIQGIGMAELLARDADIARVLVVTPASLKSQWSLEVKRFTNRSVQLISGPSKERTAQYGQGAFFTICNYEQVLRDILAVEKVAWDLIILDEGQRIKNWEAKTARVIKGLRSRFALVLSGTPLENRLEELFSVVEFIDDTRLGPAFRFYHRHRVLSEGGKVLGYRNLDELRERLKPVLLRRTRQQVLQELPPRTTEIRRIVPTDEQMELHEHHKRIVSLVIKKPYLNEMDLIRLQKALLMCRMVANGTFLVDKQAPGHSSKLRELDELIAQCLSEDGRKVVLFSEWTTMLDLIEPLLQKHRAGYVRLDGSVPQKKRQALVHAFQKDPACAFFITTNAGSTGLNLHAANTVINVDLPWNPAVLEQRIARVHRMGQKRPVQVFILVSQGTLEESLLNTLSAKQDLSLAVLDGAADVSEVALSSGIEQLKARMEILLGAQPETPLDETQHQAARAQAAEHARCEGMSRAGGQLLAAAIDFVAAMFPTPADTPDLAQLSASIKAQFAENLSAGENGEVHMRITLPSADALDALAASLARILGAGVQTHVAKPDGRPGCRDGFQGPV